MTLSLTVWLEMVEAFGKIKVVVMLAVRQFSPSAVPSAATEVDEYNLFGSFALFHKIRDLQFLPDSRVV